MIAATRDHGGKLGRKFDTFEFQMLHGVGRDFQTRLVDQRHRVRVCLPFGHARFSYFMRRLGERPTNVLFVFRSLFHEGASEYRRVARVAGRQ